MNNLIGYLIEERSSLSAVGSAYNYRLSGNGLFIMALGKHISAQIPIIETPVRGLLPAKTFLKLEHGRIPQRFWDLALSVMLASPEVEKYAGIRWDGQGYALYIPGQESEESKVRYQVGEDIVVELHSHPGMPAKFSTEDNDDEQGLKIYGVFGLEKTKVDNRNGEDALLPRGILSAMKLSGNLRVGVYGYWAPVRWGEVFEGRLQGAADINFMQEAML